LYNIINVYKNKQSSKHRTLNDTAWYRHLRRYRFAFDRALLSSRFSHQNKCKILAWYAWYAKIIKYYFKRFQSTGAFFNHL